MATSVLTIEELTGPKRRLDLIGAGLPSKGASWGGQATISTSWNAGNPEATQHVLGVQEDPSAWEGLWSTTMLIASPCQFTDGPTSSPKPISSAASLDRIMEEIRVSGQLLRVTWTNEQSGGIPPRQAQKVRLGRLQQYVGKFDHLDTINWSTNFVWISRGSQPRTYGNAQDDVLASSRNAIIAQNNAVAAIELDSIRASRKTKKHTTQFRLGDLENMANAPLQMVDSFARAADSFTREMKDIGDTILKVRAIPFQIANRALATATNAVATSNQFLDALSRRAPESLSLSQNAALMAQTAAYYGKAQTQAQYVVAANERLAGQARSRRSGLQASSTPGQASQMRPSDILSVYLPRDGDTFASIANRFYETADLGPSLARANGISGYAIKPPRRLPIIVPTRAIIDARVAAGL